MTTPDLRHIDVWLFDLDNTLYPVESSFMGLIEKKMTAYVAREIGLSHDDAFALQKRYLREHGTTLAGLMANHGIDPEAYLDEVHDVSLDSLTPDPPLRDALARLPGRRLVFTLSVSENGGLVGAGKLVRVVVDRDTFLGNVR